MLDSTGFQQHSSNNRLRDAADEYTEKGHIFSFNSDIMFSYDICGNCEAHGILLAIEKGLSNSIENSPLLKTLDSSLRKDNINLVKCPLGV